MASGLGLGLCSLLLLFLATHSRAAECPGESPAKRLVCYVERVPAEFDPCLCTHLVLQAPHLDKLTPQSELVRSAVELRRQNGRLRLVLRVAESAETALKRRAALAQTAAAVVAKCDLDGVELALSWAPANATTSTAKLHLVDLVKVLSKELEKIEPKERSKRSYKIYEDISGDVVTPRWTPQNHRSSKLRKTREAEKSEDKEDETSTVTEVAENKKQEIEEEPEEAEEDEHDKQIWMQLDAEPQALAKNYDLKRLSKYVSLWTLATDNMTDWTENGRAHHPARLMGIQDILNADSLVDLVTGLGAAHDKLVLTLPATASRFTLADASDNMPRSPVVAPPTTLTRPQLCKTMSEGEWTVERDEDLTAPFAFHNTTWIAFDDPTSASIKGKYILLRELAGAGVRGADAEDWSSACGSSGPSLVRALHDTFTHIARKSRAAQLVSLQEELHQANHFSYSGDIHLSPYRIVRVVDREGDIHVVRKEANTEFECSRQGYFRHPSGCNRFYRCVKFNQYSPDYTVFEYDCPAGLAFDETVEVCVWPGSLADSGACQGSSEIAPVPRNRYVCPTVAGYYADPENCRWFFACLDHHGDGSPLTAYEFRCPFGLVFDEQKLVCDWPWLVPGCGGAGLYTARFTVGDFYEGRHRPSYASLSDVHVSGGRIENVPGGVVLGSALSGIGTGAYQGSHASGSNVGAGVVYSGASGGSGYGLGYGSGGSSGSYLTGAGAGSAYKSGSDASGSNVGAGVVYGGASGGSGYGLGYGSGGSSGSYLTGAGAGSAYKSGSYASGSNVGAGVAYGGASGGSGYGLGYGSGASAGSYLSGAGAGSAYKSGYGTGSAYLAGSYGSGAYGTGEGAYVEDNSGAYFHDATGDTGGLYSGQESYGGQYKGSYEEGGAYVPGVYDNGAYKGSYTSGGQYKGGYEGAGAYSGAYDKGIYSGSASSGGQYKGEYDAGSYAGKYDAGAYSGKYDGGAYSGKYDGGAYSGKYDGGAYAGKNDGGAYSGKYDGGAYSGKYDGGAYAGKNDGSAYSGKYDGGAYSGKYDGGAYSGKYDGGAYSGKYDGGAYSGKYDGGAYSGASISGAQGSNYFSGVNSQAEYNAHSDGGYGSHEYNNVDVLHKQVGLDAVKVSGGDAHSGGYVTPSPLPAVSVASYSTVTPAPVLYSTVQPTTPRPVSYYPSSTVTPISSTLKPLISYSTVKPPAYVQTYEQPSYVKTVTPVPTYSYSTPTIGVVKTPVVPLSPVTYTFKQPIVNTEYVSTYSTASPVNSVSYQSTPAPTYEKGAFEYTYQKPLHPAYVPPLPSYSYEYKPQFTSYVKPEEVKYSYPKPQVLKTPIVPLNPIQYSTPAPALNPISYSGPAPVSYPSYPTTAPAVVPLNPIQYSTPAPVHVQYSTPAPIKTVSYQHQPAAPVRPNVYSTQDYQVSYEHSTVKPVVPLRPISYSTPAPIYPEYKVPTVLKTPVVPLNPVQYTTPAPVHFEYSTPAPPKPVSYIRPHSTPAPLVSYEYTPSAPIAPVEPLRPIVYSAPKPIGYEYPKPVVPFVEKSPVIPLNPIQYTTPAPQLISYGSPVVTSYSTPAPPMSYSTPAPPVYSAAPLQPLRPSVYSTPAPPVYPTVYKTPVVPLNNIQYTAPAPVRPVTYTTPAPAINYEYSAPVVKPVVPTVLRTPVVPLNPVQYTTSAPIHFGYSTPAAVPLRPISYSTPAPVLNNQYLPPAPVQPIKHARPVTYSTPEPYHTVSYEYPAPAVRPVAPVVSKAPVVPLNPIQYTAPAQVYFEHSTSAPKPLRPITYTTSSPAVNLEYVPQVQVQPLRPLKPASPISYEYPSAPVQPVVYSTPAPPASYEYQPPAPVQPVRPLKPVVYSTPAPPASYEYVPPAPVQPVRPLKPVVYSTPAPPASYEYLPPAPVQPVRPLKPVVYSTPAPPASYEYSPPAPVQPVRPLKPVVYSTPAPPASYEYLPPAPVQPVRPLKPVVYSTPAPPASYEYLPPAPVQPVKPISLSSPAPFSYDYKYQPVRPVPTVLQTPVVPLNPIQYTTPAPTPVIQYTTSAPVIPVSYVKPLKPITYTTAAPEVTYEYSTPAYKIPVPSVLKTPVVPLNPVQYSTPAPAVINQYKFGVAYQQQPEIQHETDFYYKQSAYDKTEHNEGYVYKKPALKFSTKTVSTTPIPSVIYSYETPEPVTPVYKQVYDYIRTPMVSAYEKVLNAISYSTTPAPAPLPIQPVTQSPVSYAPVDVGSSYGKPILVKTPSIPVTPISVVPEYQKVLNVVKATTTPAPVYVNHYTSSYEQELVPVSTPRPVVYRKKPAVVTESTYIKDYAYQENVDEIYDVVKSDFGTRLVGFEEGAVYNQRVEVPQVVYTSTTPEPVPVVQQTYKPRKPVKTYLPSVTTEYEGGVKYTSTGSPVVVSSSEGTYGAGEQYHKETSFSGYTGHSGDSVSYEELPVVTSTTQGTTLKVSRPEGGYYVRKQKVRVRPVVVTTDNYPSEYTSTYKPASVSTTTFAPTYSYSTQGPKVTSSSTIHPDDVVDVEGEEEQEEVKILEEFNGQYGGIVNKAGYSVSSTVASIEDGEAIVGVLKKGRITYDGRRTKSKVVVVSKLSDFNPLLVGKLGAECSCDAKSNNLRVVTRGKQRGRLFTPSGDSTIPDQQLVDSYQTSTSTAAPLVSNSETSFESASYDKVVEIRPLRKKVRYYSTTSTASPEEEEEEEEPNLVPSRAGDRVKADTVVCNRAGLFRHPNKCNKFYSCDWDQWKKKFTLNEFKCPIHLSYDSNLGACNWPSKGPACSDDNLLV